MDPEDKYDDETQMWCLLAPLLRQKHPLHIGQFTGWPEYMNFFIADNRSLNALTKLAKPGPSGPLSIKLQPAMHHLKPSTLETLPAELLACVMQNLSLEDTIALGLTSALIFKRAMGYVQMSVRQSMGSWAGTPLLCSGSLLRDLPPALYEVMPELCETKGASAVRDWNWDAVSYFEEVTHIDARQQWRDCLAAGLQTEHVGHTTAAALQSAMEDALKINGLQIGERWLLRNLTTKQYIPLEMARNDVGNVTAQVRGAPWLSLDLALLIRIFWSGPASEKIQELTKSEPTLLFDIYKRGTWAGHRFDVVLDDDQMVNDDECWRDETDSVVVDAKSILQRWHLPLKTRRTPPPSFIGPRRRNPWELLFDQAEQARYNKS